MAQRGKSRNRRQLERRVVEVVESAAQLRDALQRYEKQMLRIGARLDNGEAAVPAARGTTIPSERRQVTEAISEFEAARHQLRVALLAVGKEEGRSVSEVGRVLGISRQLAARLAAENRET